MTDPMVFSGMEDSFDKFLKPGAGQQLKHCLFLTIPGYCQQKILSFFPFVHRLNPSSGVKILP
jgi:hypothetical protein